MLLCSQCAETFLWKAAGQADQVLQRMRTHMTWFCSRFLVPDRTSVDRYKKALSRCVAWPSRFFVFSSFRKLLTNHSTRSASTWRTYTDLKHCNNTIYIQLPTSKYPNIRNKLEYSFCGLLNTFLHFFHFFPSFPCCRCLFLFCTLSSTKTLNKPLLWTKILELFPWRFSTKRSITTRTQRSKWNSCE